MKKIIIVIVIGLLVVGVIFVYIYIDSHRPRHFEVDFLNIGQGDSTLIQFANGQKMLVDCGPNKIVLSALGRHLPFYDNTIDYVLATHPDLDHYGGCVDVLKRYNVKNIITNGHTKPSDPYWQEWNKVMHEETYDDHPLTPSFARRGQRTPATIITMSSPTVWTIASDTLQFISPDPALKLDVGAADSNNYSIVFKLTHEGETFLFTGDMEVPLENELMRKYCATSTVLSSRAESRDLARPDEISPLAARLGRNDNGCTALRADTLKVGHHGSDTGSSEPFLAIVKAKKAIISVGKNKYGHPTLRVLKHLERSGAEILRTDQKGDIVVR